MQRNKNWNMCLDSFVHVAEFTLPFSSYVWYRILSVLQGFISNTWGANGLFPQLKAVLNSSSISLTFPSSNSDLCPQCKLAMSPVQVMSWEYREEFQTHNTRPGPCFFDICFCNQDSAIRSIFLNAMWETLWMCCPSIF